MVKSCCAVGCKNEFRKGGRLSFYKFPADKSVRSKWIAAVKRENWTPSEHDKLCSEHFVSGARSKDPLAPNFVPSLFKHVKSPVKRRLQREMERYQRRQATMRRRIIGTGTPTAVLHANDDGASYEMTTADTQLQENNPNAGNQEVELPNTDGSRVVPSNDAADQGEVPAEMECDSITAPDTEPQSDGLCSIAQELATTNELLFKTVSELLEARTLLAEARQQKTEVEEQLTQIKTELAEAKDEISRLQKKNDKLNSENVKLQSRVISERFLSNDDKAVKYYTGLSSYEMLKCIFDFVTIGLPAGFFACTCSPFEQYIIILMKLRLNLGDQDLAYRFGIHQSTVSRYFNKWLDVLYKKLSVFVCWPERDQLMKTMPMEFRSNFRKCVIIIDCFEVFIERPTSLMARAQTWSNYKKHNTVKFLIGITPQGSIAFISRGWGGRVSDIHLTENCGLLRNLLPGDVVLADRGFNIHEAAGMYCAEVKVPPFTRGKSS